MKRNNSENNNAPEKRPRVEVEEPVDSTESVEEEEPRDVTNHDLMQELLKTKQILLASVERNDEKMNEPANEVNVDNLGYSLSKARTINDVTAVYSEFKFLEDKKVIYCSLCIDNNKIEKFNGDEKLSGLIRTNLVEEPIDDNEMQPRSFLNLKKNIKQHIGTQVHKAEVNNLTKRNTSGLKGPESRNNSEAAMRCARICYELYKMGRPYSDYPELVALFVKSNVFMGDINHSREFTAQFLSSVANVVRQKIKEVLKEKLKQTGHERPCKIIADKDTHKHRTRQLICLTTVFPEASDLIQSVYIDHPLIKHHKTEDVAENIFSSVKNFISEPSYIGGSYHGAYFHAKKDVPKFLNEAFNVDDLEVHNDHEK